MADDAPDPRDDDPQGKREEGGLGLLFLAAAAGLALILGLVAVIGYLALSRSPLFPADEYLTARLSAPVSGHR